jgi:hypothetical protein
MRCLQGSKPFRDAVQVDALKVLLEVPSLIFLRDTDVAYEQALLNSEELRKGVA